MKRFSRSSETKHRLTKKEAYALKAIFNAMYRVGVSVTNANEAEQAIDLTARLLTYALKRKVSVDEVRARMAELMDEEMEGRDDTATGH